MEVHVFAWIRSLQKPPRYKVVVQTFIEYFLILFTKLLWVFYFLQEELNLWMSLLVVNNKFILLQVLN